MIPKVTISKPISETFRQYERNIKARGHTLNGKKEYVVPCTGGQRAEHPNQIRQQVALLVEPLAAEGLIGVLRNLRL